MFKTKSLRQEEIEKKYVTKCTRIFFLFKLIEILHKTTNL